MENLAVNFAIVGATGAVGSELLKILEKRKFPISQLHCFSSPRSAGREIFFQGKSVLTEPLTEGAFKEIDIAIFCAGGKISKEWIPQALASGTRVVDNSSAFRMDPDVPLIIPEINSHALKDRQLAACPNCSAAIMLMAVAPLHKRFKISRIVAATYQAASGAGLQAMKELEEETLAYLENRPYARTVIPHPYAFNLFPHNSPLDENGYAEEEVKMLEETRKILEDDAIWVNATCVRVPVLRAHSEALNITFSQPVSVEEVYEVLKQAPGLTILEDRARNRFPMPSDASFQDNVFCGRIRKDPSFPNTFDLWVVGDQLLKGAALNAVQIAELFLGPTIMRNLSYLIFFLCSLCHASDKTFLLFTGNANAELSHAIAACLKMEVSPLSIGQFSDGEIRIKVEENVRNKNIFIIQSICSTEKGSVNDHLMELYLTIRTMRRASAETITAVIPYYGYARQDRKTQSRVPISASDVAMLIEMAGADHIICVDLHSGQIQGFFHNATVDNLYAAPIFVRYFSEKTDLVSPVVISPDAGGVERAKKFIEGLAWHGIDAELAIIVKQRAEAGVVDKMNLVGTVSGCDVIIVDDICDTAGTLIKAAQELKNAGARRVFACITHPVLSGSALQRISDSCLEELVVTDTIPKKAAMPSNMVQLSIAPLIAEAIHRINNGDSISHLFTYKDRRFCNDSNAD